MIKSTLAKISLIAFLATLGTPYAAVASSNQIESGFDPNTLISDQAFADVDTFSTSEGIQKFLEKKGEGLHHVALATDDIEKEYERMEGCGIQFLGKIRSGSEGTKIIFIHPKSLHGVLAELCSHPDADNFMH